MPRAPRLTALARRQCLADARASTDNETRVYHLLRTWQACRDPRLGEVIEALSADLAARVPRTIVLQRELLATSVAVGTPAAVATALRLPWPTTGVQGWRQLRALASLPPDPRVTTAVLNLLANFPYDTRVRQILGVALTILERSGERRALAAWQGAGAGLRAQVTAWNLSDHAQRRLEGKLLAAGTRDDVLTDDELDLLQPLRPRTRHPARSLDDLYAEVYANPALDAPREVLADALVEAGDPRGELIQLQLARARGAGSAASRARERALLAAHGASWTLLRAIDPRTVEFERGFPARAHVVLGGSHAPRDLLADPRWSTFVALDWPGSEGVNLSPLVHLQEVYLYYRRTTAGLPPNICVLGEHHALALLHAAPPTATALCTAELEQPTLVPRRFRSVRFTARISAAPAARLLAGLPPTVEEVELALAPAGRTWARVGWGLRLRRTSDGLSTGEVAWHGGCDEDRLSAPEPWALRLPKGVRQLQVPARLASAHAAIRRARPDLQVDLLPERREEPPG